MEYQEITAWSNVVQAVGFPIVVTWFLLTRVTPFVIRLADEVKALREAQEESNKQQAVQTEVLRNIRNHQLGLYKGEEKSP